MYGIEDAEWQDEYRGRVAEVQDQVQRGADSSEPVATGRCTR